MVGPDLKRLQVVERWILARLRNQRFFTLAELNAAIAVLVADLNAPPMRGSRSPVSK